MRVARLMLLPTLLLCAVQPARAESSVSLELVTEAGFPALESQKWLRMLTDLGIDGLTIRAARGTDKAEIVTDERGHDRAYRVIGVLTGRNELIVPGGRFGIRDSGKIAAWITRLKEDGPPGQDAGVPKLFGLEAQELSSLRKVLAQPVNFPTQDIPAADVVDAIIERLELRAPISRSARAALNEADPVGEDLQGLACGTALACVLRPAGLGFAPRGGAGGFELDVISPTGDQLVWPVGLSAEEERDTILPKVMEFLEVEFEDVPLPGVVSAIGERLETPMLYDHVALAIRRIDPATKLVSLPAKRTTYSLALRKSLGQARLKSILRVDDAGKPFFWITTMIPAE
jgi:hypothetical protein